VAWDLVICTSVSGTGFAGKLYELSQAASNDFGRFRAVAEPIESRSA
jgi:hypothetical protein